MENIITFASVILFAAIIGSLITPLISGRLPTGGKYGNPVVFGKSIDTGMLYGLRARLVTLAMIILFGLFALAISSQNILILGNTLYSNIVAIISGLIIGILLRKFHFFGTRE